MIFSETWQKVIRGEKTQTRRVKAKGDYLDCYKGVQTPNAVYRLNKNGIIYPAYVIGKQYPVQPYYGAKSIARIEIADIYSQAPVHITYPEVVSEGFVSHEDFYATLTKLHPKVRLEVDGFWVLTFKLISVSQDMLDALPECS